MMRTGIIAVLMIVSLIIGYIFGYDMAYLDGKDAGREEMEWECVRRKFGHYVIQPQKTFAWRSNKCIQCREREISE